MSFDVFLRKLRNSSCMVPDVAMHSRRYRSWTPTVSMRGVQVCHDRFPNVHVRLCRSSTTWIFLVAFYKHSQYQLAALIFFEKLISWIDRISGFRACSIGHGRLSGDAVSWLNIEVLNCGRAAGYDIISRGLSELAQG